MWEEKEILIVVKTYPAISSKYVELVCTAGITSEGNWIRLYPINFRTLPPQKQYCKYQWIKAKVQKHDSRDKRKESYRIDLDSIELGEKLDTGNGWARRKKIVLPTATSSLEELWDSYDNDKTSLGIFKPKEVKFKIEPDTTEWSEKQLAQMEQTDIFQGKKLPLEKIPYKFSYVIKCNNPGCKGHKLSIHDWEIMQLYRNVRDKYDYAQDIILEKVKEKYLDEMWREDKDSYLIVGTTGPVYKSFITIGVFWPPVST